MRDVSRLVLVFSTLLVLVLLEAVPSGASTSFPQDPIEFTTKHLPLEELKRTPDCCTAQGKQFVVASAGTGSAAAAKAIKEKGCNVVDAAVAATFALAVERPQSTGIGGGGFMTLRLKQGKNVVSEFVDFRETAPRTARADMFQKDGKVVENLSRDGVHAAGTPGFVAGLYYVHEKYGSKNKPKCSWAELLKPAIALAEKGFEVYPAFVNRLEIRKNEIVKDPEASKLLLPEGKPVAVGDTFVQKDLANTLRRIAKTGKKDFYSGETAKKIAAYIKAHALPGVPYVDETDLKNYRVSVRAPLKGTFQGFEIWTAPPPSAGGVLMLETLNVLSPLNLAAIKSQTEYIHLMSDVFVRTFADRMIIGDKSKNYQRLLTAEYAANLRKGLSKEKAIPAKDVQPGIETSEKPHTAHTSILDSDGNAVSVTTTVNYLFGAGVLVPGTGVFLNDEMDDFSSKTGASNISNLPGSEANAIAPLKRPVSSMMPTIVLKGDKPVLVLGAAGSSTIVTGVTQVVINDLVIWPYDLKKAVFAGRLHRQYNPTKDTLTLEPGAFAASTETALKNLGYQLAPFQFSASVQAAGMNPQTGVLTAVHDPRDFAAAEGF